MGFNRLLCMLLSGFPLKTLKMSRTPRSFNRFFLRMVIQNRKKYRDIRGLISRKMRHWRNGSVLAFQAKGDGSNPLWRFVINERFGILFPHP